MADTKNDLKPVHYLSTNPAITEIFSQWKKKREKELEEFRNRQLFESPKLFEQILNPRNETTCSELEEPPKVQVPECSDASSISLMNDLDNSDSIQDSSVTGHLQRCFDDSAQSNSSLNPNKVSSATEKVPVFSEIRNPQFSTKNIDVKEVQLDEDANNVSSKPKRSFLKKGTGLLRYMPKSKVSRQVSKTKETCKSNFSEKKSTHVPQRTLKLKPAIRKTYLPSESVKHIRFDIPISENEKECVTENNLSPVSKSIVDEESKCEFSSPSTPVSSSSFEHSPEVNKSEVSKSENERLNLLKENKELEEFEMLENCAQNSSFSSDSSVVLRVLHGESIKSHCQSQKNSMKLSSENVVPVHGETLKTSSERANFSDKIGFNKSREEIQAKKQILQKVISDINPRIQSLQKEIASSKQKSLDDFDMCSTSGEDEKKIPASPSGNNSYRESLYTENYLTNFEDASDDVQKDACQYGCCDIDNVLNSCSNEENTVENDEEESVSEVSNEVHEEKDLVEKSIMREKRIELETEILTYKRLNADLLSKSKEREEVIRKFQKEREDFSKYMEAEKKKLEAEIEEERRQIKRQKDTFSRFQKLRKNHPTRREREEMNALRQEVEKLQEELKRQKIKYTSDFRRWKTRLENAEAERDNFKLENIRLEEQCQDLLTTLKARMKKKPEPKTNNVDEENMQKNIIKDIPVTKDVACQTHEKDLRSDANNLSEIPSKSGDTKTVSASIHNLIPECEKNESYITGDVEDETKEQYSGSSYPSFKSSITASNNLIENGKRNDESDRLSAISVSVESTVKEVCCGDKGHRIFPSGDKEIIFPSGTRKIISADGKTVKFLFYNCDVKEIFPDKEVYTYYATGITETLFSDGLKVTEFPNGQVQRHYPDGRKEVKFPNGTVRKIYPDGSEGIQSADENVTSVCGDKKEVTEFPNGQREIRTATYRKREFPDGSVRIFYHSGRKETRYPNGRIKIKNKEGKVILDTKYIIKEPERVLPG